VLGGRSKENWEKRIIKGNKENQATKRQKKGHKRQQHSMGGKRGGDGRLAGSQMGKLAGSNF